jgi:hypothetical protein
MRPPRIFIGSSSEHTLIAATIQEELDNDAKVTIWTQDIFKPGNNIIDDLNEALSQSDFGLFVFTPDDIINIKGETKQATRDNVVFELGLCMGKLGKNRTFFITPEEAGTNFRICSDLAGINFLKYKANRDDNLNAALGPACNQIRRQIKKLGIRRDSIDILQSQKDVYAYVFNHLNPYNNIALTQNFLKASPDRRFLRIDDVIFALDILVHHYVPQFIEPRMRVYFAYKLQMDSGAPQQDGAAARYRVGISYSEYDDKWCEGFVIGSSSNIDRVYRRKSISKVRDARVHINKTDIQNEQVDDEGSVIALPVLYNDDYDNDECIGVIGISSPKKEEVTQPEYEALAHELSILFSALFYAYGRYLQKSKNFNEVAEQIRFEITDHFESKF